MSVFPSIDLANKDGPPMDFEGLIKKTFVDLTVKIDRPETLISIGEHQYKDKSYPTSVMTSGEFSCIVAPSKTKKSFLKSAICASYIGGNSNQHFDNIKGHRNEDYFILDIDTEQSSYYAQKTFQRVTEITGIEYKNHIPFKLRALSVYERLALIEHLIYKSEYSEKLKLVFIDGIADLMMDVNDMEKSNEIANYLLKWTEEKNIHICVIIHSAFGTKKATGNLGSTLIKKAESVLMLDPTDGTKKVIKTIHQYSRGYGFDDFYFSIKDTDALPYKVDENSYQFPDNEKTSNIDVETNSFLTPFTPVTPSEAFNLDSDIDVPF